MGHQQTAANALHQVLTDEQYGQFTSAELLAAYQSVRDEDAFRTLVRRYGGMVLRACRAILPSDDLAGEALQEAFTRLATAPLHSARGGAIAHWLRTVARRQAINIRRRERRRAAREVRPPPAESAPSAEQTALGGELRTQVSAALAALPERFRLPLELSYFDGLTHAEVATALGCPKGTVDSNISRGLDRLKTLLKDVAAPAAALAVAGDGVARAATPTRVTELLAAAARAVPARRWLGWKAVAAAGLAAIGGGVGVVWSDLPAPEPAAAVATPSAVVESLPDRNLRLFDERVKGPLLTALAPIALGDGTVSVVELRGFDTRIRVVVEARHGVVIPDYPPVAHVLLVFDTESRRLAVETSMNPGGRWRPVDPDKPVVWINLPALGVNLKSKPAGAAAAFRAFDPIPRDPRGAVLLAAREVALRAALEPYLGEWISDGGRHRVERDEPLGLTFRTGDEVVQVVSADDVWRCEPGTSRESRESGLLHPFPHLIELTPDGRTMMSYRRPPWRRE